MWSHTRTGSGAGGPQGIAAQGPRHPIRFNLKVRFTLTICCLLALSVISLGWIVLLQVEKSALRGLMEKGAILARSVANTAELGVFTHNTAELEVLLRPLRDQADIVYAGVADEHGVILTEHRHPEAGEVPDWAAPDASAMEDRRSTEPARAGDTVTGSAAWRPAVFESVARRPGTPVYYTRVDIRVSALAPIADESGMLIGVPSRGRSGRRIGFACVGVSAGAVMDEIRVLRRGLVLVTLAVLLVGVAIAIFLVRIIVEPIKYLVYATERVASGDLDILIPRRGRDEIGALTESFNRMTLHLRDSRRALQRSNLDLEQKVRERTQALRETQDQLIQAEKMTVVGQLVSGVAHELNNPLAGVLGFTQLLLRRGPAEDVSRGLKKIEVEAERCKRIVQNLLIFARKHKPQKTSVDLNAVVERILEMRGYHLKTDNIEVVRQLDPLLPRTMADENQIQQVLMNILNNAQHAMLERAGPRTLRIETRIVGDRIHLVVGDNGSGIAPENLKRIFDPFFTTKDVGRGTGLGLSICYGIVQEHGGDIRVASTRGSGTTCTIDLPVVAGAEPAAARAAEEASAGAAARPGRILLVDDEMSILEIIGDVLRLDGHEVVATSNGQVALERLRREHFDLVVSDLKMPHLSGQDLFARVVEVDPALVRRVVFTTGDTANPETHAFLEGTGNPWLQKPFDIDAVRRIVQRMLKAA